MSCAGCGGEEQGFVSDSKSGDTVCTKCGVVQGPATLRVSALEGMSSVDFSNYSHAMRTQAGHDGGWKDLSQKAKAVVPCKLRRAQRTLEGGGRLEKVVSRAEFILRRTAPLRESPRLPYLVARCQEMAGEVFACWTKQKDITSRKRFSLPKSRFVVAAALAVLAVRQDILLRGAVPTCEIVQSCFADYKPSSRKRKRQSGCRDGSTDNGKEFARRVYVFMKNASMYGAIPSYGQGDRFAAALEAFCNTHGFPPRLIPALDGLMQRCLSGVWLGGCVPDNAPGAVVVCALLYRDKCTLVDDCVPESHAARLLALWPKPRLVEAVCDFFFLKRKTLLSCTELVLRNLEHEREGRPWVPKTLSKQIATSNFLPPLRAKAETQGVEEKEEAVEEEA